MANVIIKSDERRANEAYVLQSFSNHGNDSAAREAAEIISARSSEAYQNLRRMEEQGK